MTRGERVARAAADARAAVESLLDELGWPQSQPISRALDELRILEEEQDHAARVLALDESPESNSSRGGET